MSEKNRAIDLRTFYLRKSPDTLLKDFPNRPVRILFPKMPYTQDTCKDRINAVVVNGLITKLWIG